MDRLTETVERDGKRLFRLKGDAGFMATSPENNRVMNAVQKLADYEDAEEQNRLVPVVRCHECAYRDKDWWSEERVHCELHSEEPDQMYTGFDMIMPKDGYCSYGEREEPPV